MVETAEKIQYHLNIINNIKKKKKVGKLRITSETWASVDIPVKNAVAVTNNNNHKKR